MKSSEKRMAIQKDISGIENTLSHALTPVSPSVDVVKRLKERIGNLEPNRIAKRLSNWELSIITVGSVMSAAMVILTIVRALFYFWGRSKRSAV